MSPTTVFLPDFFPRAGFRWRRGQGSPRVLRSGPRDAVVFRALVDLAGGGGGVRMRKRDAQRVVVAAVATTARLAGDDEHGVRAGEDAVDFLLRAAGFSELARALPGDVWVELVYQMANARSEYKRHASEAQKLGEADQLTALSFAVDDLVDAIGNSWDWATLEFYVYPHLMGEAVDYEVDEDEDDDDADAYEDTGDNKVAPVEGSADSEMVVENGLATAGENAAEDLPGRMEGLQIMDDDGDVEMMDLM